MAEMRRYASIGRNMNIADKYFRLFLRDALSPYDLNTAEGTVLLSMYEKSEGTEQQIFHSIHSRPTPGNTQDELICSLHYDKGVMTRTMKSLEDKGFVARKSNPADSRSSLFSLTEKGTAMKGVLIAALRQWNGVLLSGVPDETLAILEGALDTMAQNAVAYFRDKGARNAETPEKGI